MSFLNRSLISEDPVLMRRVAACAAEEGVTEYATSWAARNLWILASSPGWDEAYSRSRDAGNSSPGGDEGAITDVMIRADVRALIAVLTPPAETHEPEEPAPPVEGETEEVA